MARGRNANTPCRNPRRRDSLRSRRRRRRSRPTAGGLSRTGSNPPYGLTREPRERPSWGTGNPPPIPEGGVSETLPQNRPHRGSTLLGIGDKEMKRSILGAFAILFAATSLAQATPSVESATIMDYGIYRVELTGEHTKVPTAAAGAVEPARSARLIETTNRIPATVGTSFGCHFVLKGEPDGSSVPLDIVVQHTLSRCQTGRLHLPQTKCHGHM